MATTPTPNDPKKPAQPGQPAKPAQPAGGTPAKPPATGQPAKPPAAKPGQPAKPQAAKPGQPAKPAAPKPAPKKKDKSAARTIGVILVDLGFLDDGQLDSIEEEARQTDNAAKKMEMAIAESLASLRKR